jgi:hypothetical protein
MTRYLMTGRLDAGHWLASWLARQTNLVKSDVVGMAGQAHWKCQRVEGAGAQLMGVAQPPPVRSALYRGVGGNAVCCAAPVSFARRGRTVVGPTVAC